MQTRKDGSISSYYRESLDYPHTQTAKSRSGNETVREAWSYLSQLHVVTKVFLECPIRHLWLQEVFLKVLPLVTRGVEVP